MTPHPLSAWSERRPQRCEAERSTVAAHYAAHLPEQAGIVMVSDADLDAMKAAFIKRFDEDLPRTETLMAVAHVGYRMALRDLASADTHPKDGDVQQAPLVSGAVARDSEADAQKEQP